MRRWLRRWREMQRSASEEVDAELGEVGLGGPDPLRRPSDHVGARPDVAPVVPPTVSEVGVEVSWEDITEKLNWEMVDAEGRPVTVWEPVGDWLKGLPEWREPKAARGVDRVVRLAVVARKPYTQLRRWLLALVD